MVWGASVEFPNRHICLFNAPSGANCYRSGTGRDMEEVVKAAARVLIASALNILQSDPHQWSMRPCPTCRAVSAIVGRPFGCDLYRIQCDGKAKTDS